MDRDLLKSELVAILERCDGDSFEDDVADFLSLLVVGPMKCALTESDEMTMNSEDKEDFKNGIYVLFGKATARCIAAIEAEF